MHDQDNIPKAQKETDLDDRTLPDRELLVAYLDGELDADEARHVEQLMARDARVENEVRRLERAWSLLDRLPRAAVSPSFTESTVEMAALAVQDELRVADGKRRGAAWSAALVAACIVGFLAARLWPDANRQLLRDLPLVDNVEAYRQTPQIDFLRELAKSGVFDGEEVTTVNGVSFAERKKWLDSLEADQKEDLHRKYERFSQLPADEQLRLRKLQATVASHAEATQLTKTLALFQRWLEQLAGVERAELMALDGEQRLQRVKRMRRDEARRLASEDVRAFMSWFEGAFARALPPVPRARIEKELAGASEDQRPAVIRRALQGLLPKRGQAPRTGQGGQRPGRLLAGSLINPQALAELGGRLSPHGQQVLNKARTEAERQTLVWSWARQAYGPFAARGNPLSLPDVDEDELKRFFEQLSPVQRTQLLNLPADQMKRQLLVRYQAKRAAEKRQKTEETKP
jgi:anti-sigma-K factor RskA